MNQTPEPPGKPLGLIYGLTAYGLWGFLTLYWRVLKHVPSEQIVAHRIVWSAIVLCPLVFLSSRKASLRLAFSDLRVLSRLFLTSSLICSNWLIFIWAVNHDHVIETSLGYFLTPLMIALFGVFLLHEKLTRPRKIALGFAAASISLLALSYGHFPWIALSLAVTFSLYTLLRKTARVGSLEGLFIETIMATPVAIAFLVYTEIEHTGAFLTGTLSDKLLLFFAGPVTATPLLLFVAAARLTPLSTMAAMQYLAPSIGFLLGVFVLNEPFGTEKFIAFIGVWIAVTIYVVEALWWPRDGIGSRVTSRELEAETISR